MVGEAAILAAAGRLFRRQGYAATTVREIAREASVLPGSLHYRFATKDSLLAALMEQAMERALAGVQSAVAGARGPLARMQAAAAEHLRQLLAGDDAVFVLLYEQKALAGKARERVVLLRDRYEALWDDLLSAAAVEGLLHSTVDRRLLRLQLLGTINWTAQWFSPGGPYTPEELAAAFIATLVRGAGRAARDRSPRGRRRKAPP